MTERHVRFCTKCGRKLVLSIRADRFGDVGDMELVGRCPAFHLWSQNHDFVSLAGWNVGPLYDPYTGERRRD